jgi:acetyl-CoA carboxylase biotin carboxylase subunit
MLRALGEYHVSGIRTNLGFFRQILEDTEFRAGRLHTGFIGEFFERHRPPQPSGDLAAVAALAGALHTMSRNGMSHNPAPGPQPASPWLQAGRGDLLR